jgi:hypothetical protein
MVEATGAAAGRKLNWVLGRVGDERTGEKAQGAQPDFGAWVANKQQSERFFYKRIQTIEFKYRFEFNKIKIMQQHVCNKHQAIYLFSKNK